MFEIARRKAQCQVADPQKLADTRKLADAVTFSPRRRTGQLFGRSWEPSKTNVMYEIIRSGLEIEEACGQFEYQVEQIVYLGYYSSPT